MPSSVDFAPTVGLWPASCGLWISLFLRISRPSIHLPCINIASRKVARTSPAVRERASTRSRATMYSMLLVLLASLSFCSASLQPALIDTLQVKNVAGMSEGAKARSHMLFSLSIIRHTCTRSNSCCFPDLLLYCSARVRTAVLGCVKQTGTVGMWLVLASMCAR